MKKFLLLFLLIASPCFGQRFISQGTGALTVSVQDAQDYQISVIGNITGITLATTSATPNGLQVTFRFTENSVGGWTIVFGGNVTTTCPITTTANATSICRLQYNAGTNVWNDAGGSGGGGLSFVSNGLIAQCPMTETSGTTISCGAAGNGTLGSSAPAVRFNPLFVSVPGIGNIQAMDNCTDTFNTQGHWTLLASTNFSSNAALACGATSLDGNNNAWAVYNGIPTSAGIGQNQFCEVTQQQAASTGYIGCLLRFQTAAVNGYVCYIDNGGTATIASVSAGTITVQKSAASTALVVGDTLACTVQETGAFTGANFVLYKNGVSVTSINNLAHTTFGWNGQTGMFAHLGSASSGRMSFATGYNLDTTTSGGLAFGGGQQVTLPASLNSAQTIQVFACFQQSNTSNLTNALVAGDGGGAAGNFLGMALNGAATADTLQGPTPKVVVLGGTGTTQGESFQGCGVVSATFGTAPALDRIYINNQETGSYGQNLHSSSAGLQTTGNYQIGGNPLNFGYGGINFFNGLIYYVLMYNRPLLPSEIYQNYYAMQQAMQARGVNVSVGNLSNCDAVVAMGDSQTTGSGLGTPTTQAWPQNIVLFSGSNQNVYCNGGKAYNSAVGGTTVGSAQSTITAALTPFGAIPDYYCDPFFTGNGTRNVCVLWDGTNDLFQTGTTTGVGSNILQADVMNYLKARRIAGWKTIFVDMISRGTGGSCTFDGNKDAFNPLVRLSWPKFTDGFVDLASDPAFADGGCTTSAFNADNIHPSAHGHINLIATRIGREINAIFGNTDWSSATTLTATSTAATTITAATEATNTVTLTMGANPWAVGQCVIVTGVTPAGYNSAANQCFLVLTSTATQLTYFDPTSGLGAGSVFGTVQAPQELDQDVYEILGGTTANNHILQTCLGRTGHTIYRMHTNSTNAWTVTSQFGETINGGATFTMPTASATNHPIVSFTSVLTSNTAGGCTWHAAW